MRRAEGASDARRLRGKRGVGVATAHAQSVKGAVGVASVRVGGVGVATAHKQRVKGGVGVASARVGGAGVATAHAQRGKAGRSRQGVARRRHLMKQ